MRRSTGGHLNSSSLTGSWVKLDHYYECPHESLTVAQHGRDLSPVAFCNNYQNATLHLRREDLFCSREFVTPLESKQLTVSFRCKERLHIMDPLTAFSLAGTVIQFVDFGSKLILGANELYRSTSGSLTANEELSLVTTDVQSVLSKLISFAQMERPPDVDADSKRAYLTSEEVFEKACVEAQSLAAELLERLNKLKVRDGLTGPQRAISSLSMAVKSAWTSDELHQMQQRLKNVKEAIETRVLISFREKFDLVAIQTSQRFDTLDRQTQYIISALSEDRRNVATRVSSDDRELTSTMVQLLSRIEVQNAEEHRRTRQLISAQGSRTIVPAIELNGVSFEEEANLRREAGNQILNNLRFESMTHRYEEVAEAHGETFDWIFRPSDEDIDDVPWTNFASWLKSNDGLYWMKGKAGSGKSTLMKYIFDDSRTRQYLETWAGGMPLRLSSFFFWNSGTRDQKSQQGLLRAILFDILNQQPDLIPIVFPLIWSRAYSRVLLNQTGIVNEAWSVRQLKFSFQTLASQTIVPTMIFLLIDGLDEFDGDHEEMSELFKNVGNSPHMKVCVSSRPWVVFEEAFAGFPGLRLQDLTQKDIQHYVDNTFGSNTAFRRLATQDPGLTSTLISEVVEKADGVFLWVILVTQSLLNGLRNRDSIPTLRERLRKIPRELEPLYNHLLDMIEPEYFSWAGKAFQLVRASQELEQNWEGRPCLDDPTGENAGLTALRLHFALEEGLTVTTVRSWKPADITRRTEDAQFHLTARCAGLLEVSHSERRKAPGVIQYLHRTAHDFLLQPASWDRILSWTSHDDFSADICILESYCLWAAVTLSGLKPYKGRVIATVRHALYHAINAEQSPRKVPPSLLDELDSVMSLHTKSFIGKGNWREPFFMARELHIADSFLEIAVALGLDSYVDNYLTRYPRDLQSRTEFSLLHYAIPRAWNALQLDPYPRPKPSTVRLLIQRQESPNVVYELKSPWQQALSHARGLEEAGSEALFEAMQILTIMLDAGADPRIHILVRGSIYSVKDLVSSSREQFGLSMPASASDPPEITNLSRAIERASASGGLVPIHAYRDDLKKSKRKSISNLFRKLKV